MDFWDLLFNIAVLLAVAVLLGAVFERLRQSALLGYLLAGALLGPNVFNVIRAGAAVDGLSELGVSLLLFSIGLEFSWKRLRGFGAAALVGGTLQIVLTAAVAAAASLLLGASWPAAVILGAAASLSSTACVVRVLQNRTEVESLHGRQAIAVLLLQDLAVIPLMVAVSLLTGTGAPNGAILDLLRNLFLLLGLVAACFIVFNVLAPRFLHEAAVLRNRELPILFAAAGGLGATWLTHRLGLSPAIGAFIGGMLLAESPFANQVRADLASLRTLLVTLFFGSVGMLADIPWMVEHIVPVLLATAAVLIGKSLIAWLSLRLAGLSHVSSLAAAICLAQVGEFSFVIISAARGDLLGEHVFLLAVSTMMLSLFLTPYLVSGAPAAAKKSLAVLRRFGILGGEARPAPDPRTDFMGHVILIGYGPAGERVGQILAAQKAPAWVLDLNPQLVKKARETGLNAQIGDATHPEVLEHLHPASARAIIVTLPDPAAVRTIISLARAHAPEAVIVARCRYHIHRSDLEGAGASVVVDEEDEVGGLLGTKLVEVAGLARKEVESNAAAAETV